MREKRIEKEVKKGPRRLAKKKQIFSGKTEKAQKEQGKRERDNEVNEMETLQTHRITKANTRSNDSKEKKIIIINLKSYKQT